MIYDVLKSLADELGQFLMLRFSNQDSQVVLGAILNQAGHVPLENENKVILSFINLELDKIKQFATNSTISNPASEIHLDVLATAMFTNYGESLKYLYSTVSFFQQKSVFTRENTPELNPDIEKMTVEIVNTNYQEMQNIWIGLGAKHTPSVLLKVRMIADVSDQPIRVVSEISNIPITEEDS